MIAKASGFGLGTVAYHYRAKEICFACLLMKAYNIPEKERKQTIEKILKPDYEQTAKELFDKFVNRLDNDVEKNE